MTLDRDDINRLRCMVIRVSELRVIDLMRDYTVVRDNYFGASIPPVEDIFIRFLPVREMLRCGCRDGFSLSGSYKGAKMPYVIGLAEDKNECETHLNLLHEMAHLKINIKFKRRMGHGEHWKKEMRRLAAAGAMDNWW